MILVTGATGHFGKATIDFLLQKGVPASEIAALVRDEAKAADLKEKGIILKKGDYENYASLVAAFKGADKLLLVSSNDLNNRSNQQINAVKAAKEAGVPYILYTSFERKNETSTSPIAFIAQSHIATEKAIKGSGLTYTIFRNNLYMDFIPVFIGEKVVETGIFWPAGETGSAVVLRADMAEAAANVLISEGHAGKEYAISNSENVSFREVAAQISKASGRQVAYTSPDQELYKSTLTQAGVPAEYVGMFAAFGEAIKQGEFESNKTDLETLLGRKAVTTSEYLQQLYSSAN